MDSDFTTLKQIELSRNSPSRKRPIPFYEGDFMASLTEYPDAPVEPLANEQIPETANANEPPLRVMALHALLYCERLFYLEEVEEIRVADHAVYAGRRLHEEVAPLEDEGPERRSVEVASEAWGLLGKVDAIRRRDGVWVAYEHKRGRCLRGEQKEPLAWPSDRIQAIAYAVLLEESLGEPVPEARVRYHADNVTAFVTIDDAARGDLAAAIARARALRRTTQRPPVAENENLCKRCSLAPVCLPEEERLLLAEAGDLPATDTDEPEPKPPPTLFPSNRERTTLHVVSPKARVGRSGESLTVASEDEERNPVTQRVPIEQIDALVVHGFGQVTTQAIHLCAARGVSVQWLTAGGKFAAGTSASPGRVQQRIRQYSALSEQKTKLELARRLVQAKVETQLRYLLRATRGSDAARSSCAEHIERIRESLRRLAEAASDASLRGLEGMAAKAYFAAMPHLLSSHVPAEMRPQGRTKHPPRDRFNCLLSFGYQMIFTAVHRAALAVGLEPAFGFYHVPRSAAPPLVMDVMELFRTNLWEMPLIGSVNRMQWDVDDDFAVSPGQVWLNEAGRKKAIGLFEERLEEAYRHPHTGQSLSYSRMIELELRLLEKEWTGCPGLFAKWRLR
jgi:CRISPR-associated protein Cas1